MSFYIVAGMGKSGIAAAKLLIAGDDSVILFDENRNADVQKAIEAVFGDELFADDAEDEAAEDGADEDPEDADGFPEI